MDAGEETRLTERLRASKPDQATRQLEYLQWRMDVLAIAQALWPADFSLGMEFMCRCGARDPEKTQEHADPKELQNDGDPIKENALPPFIVGQTKV